MKYNREMIGLALLAIVLFAALFVLLVVGESTYKEKPIGGMVIIASNHPTNEQEFIQLQQTGIKITESEDAG